MLSLNPLGENSLVPDILAPTPAGIMLLYGNQIPRALVWHLLLSYMHHGGDIYYIDGDNTFGAYEIARLAHYYGMPPHQALKRIRVSRTFTVYQMAELIRRLPYQAGSSSPFPPLVICAGLLQLFYDRDVPPAEARRTLRSALAQLRAWNASRGGGRNWPILLTGTLPPPNAGDRRDLLSACMHAAQTIHRVETLAEGVQGELVKPKPAAGQAHQWRWNWQAQEAV